MDKIALFIGSVCLLLACKSRQPAPTSQEMTFSADTTAVQAPPQEQPRGGLSFQIEGIVVDESFQPPEKPSNARILKAKIKGDSLYVTFEFGGGCRPHTFRGISRNAFAESMPPQLTLYFEHVSSDMCRALLRKEFAFDLTPARYSGAKEVVLHLTGFEESLLYRYEG
ncbi:MAG: hypothetical protein F6K11_01115 [Leptolyngbya sp. SIO3F4]|nr:hypothetical protein [Leptolyngbya sp. SIO3F4]